MRASCEVRLKQFILLARAETTLLSDIQSAICFDLLKKASIRTEIPLMDAFQVNLSVF